MKIITRPTALILIILTVLSSFYAFCFATNAAEVLDMSVTFIDCGQGDAILISSEGKYMLVDAGKKSNSENVINYLRSLGITKLDYAIASHPDEDHIGGMPSVYEKFQVKQSLFSPYETETLIYKEYMKAVSQEPDSYYKIADINDDFSLGDAKVDVIYDGKQGENSNDSSLVLKVVCGNTSVLLTGDISDKVESKLLNSNIDSDILKVAHHGSASSSSEGFLNAVTPKISVISVGKDNSYGHPTKAALQRISAVSPLILRTDLEGDITLEIKNDIVSRNDSIISSSKDPDCTEKIVYVTANGTKYHLSKVCSNMKSPIAKEVNNAIKLGYKPCSKCVEDGFEESLIPHKFTSSTTKATFTKNGKTVKKCTVCEKIESSSTIRRIYSVKLSGTKFTYNGKIKSPSVTVKDSAGKVVSSKYYTVKYASGRKNVGKYKVTVTFKGKYSGTKNLYFIINPAKTTVSKLTAGKKSIKVYITKKTSQVTGYQIQYSTSKTFKSYKTKTLPSYKTTCTTLSSLSAKKTYYVRVRTYKTVNGTRYYSGWSSYKYKKTK